MGNAATFASDIPDVTPREAWGELTRLAPAQLIDVRSQPEWQFVGIPDLATLDKQVVLESLQSWPEMRVDPAFAARLAARLDALGVEKAAPLFFICRSGARSRKAALLMREAGYRDCRNVAGGFEGDRDLAGHRGAMGGWKVDNLPWSQE